MLAPSSSFLANPLCWALLGVQRQVVFFASKTKNHTKIHRCQVQSSFAVAEKRSDDEKAAGNALCIYKAFEDVWAFFCPSKPCVSLSIEGNLSVWEERNKTGRCGVRRRIERPAGVVT